jgi:hypothetical protein
VIHSDHYNITDNIFPVESFKVELVVYRGIAQSSKHSEALYEWASGVVTHACCDRRNIRVCSIYVTYQCISLVH